MTTETLTGISTRPILLSYAGTDRVVRDFRQVPAGTELYVSVPRAGLCIVRFPGTLFTQRVPMSAVEPA